MSEIRVDTISEKTSANGVAIDSLAIKDGKITNLMNATLSAADLGLGIHIKEGDSGVSSVSTDADQLVIENNAESGITLLAPTNSASRIAFGDSGNSKIGMVYYNHASDFMKFNVNDSEALRIDSSGNVGIGDSAPDTILHVNQGGEPPAEGMLILEANSASRQLRIQPPTDSDNGFIDYRGGNLVFLDDGTEVFRFQGSSEVVVNDASNDLDFRVESNGNSKMFFVDGGNDAVIFNGNSSDYEASSQMVQIHNAGLHITSGYGIQGGVNADRAQIGLTSGASGHIVFKANNSEVARFTTGGLAIGGTGAANTLDDYEEGTWTPVIAADAGAGAYGSQLGDYTKIGRQVTAFFTINISTIGSFSGASITVTGLPFASGNFNRHTFGVLFLDGTASAVQAAGDLAIRLTNNSSTITFQGNSGNTSGDNNINANVIDTGTFIHGSITYFTG